MASYSDNFATDTISSFDQSGVPGDASWDSVGQSVKRATTAGDLVMLRKTAAADPTNGWTPEEDQKVRLKYVTSATLSARYGPIIKATDGSNYLRAEVTISEDKLQVERVVAGVAQGAAINFTGLPEHNPSSPHWVELEIQDDQVAARWGRNDPASNPWEYDSGFVDLPAAYIEDYGRYAAGRVGFLFQPGSTSHRVDDLTLEDANNVDLRAPHDANPPDYSVSPVPYSKDLYPPSDWLPLDPENVMNQPIPANPRIHPRSDEIVANVLATADPTFSGGPQQLIANNLSTSDFSVPCYFAEASDPLYTVTKNSDYSGSWPWEGVQILCPTDAAPSGGGDHHMFIIQPDGVVWDLFDVVKTEGPNLLTIASGSRIDSPYVRASGGLGWHPGSSDYPIASIASVTCGIHGLIWPKEMEAGVINHALQMLVKWTDRTSPTYPGRGLAAGADDPTDQPLCGMRFQLDYTEAEIDALTVDPWQRIILKCMAEYGMIVTDTTGSRWGIRGFISPATFTSFGWDEPMVRYAQLAIGDGANNIVESAGKFFYRLHPGVDWSRLRVLDVAEGQKLP